MEVIHLLEMIWTASILRFLIISTKDLDSTAKDGFQCLDMLFVRSCTPIFQVIYQVLSPVRQHMMSKILYSHIYVYHCMSLYIYIYVCITGRLSAYQLRSYDTIVPRSYMSHTYIHPSIHACMHT